MISQIESNLFIGPYPASDTDLFDIKNLGVNVVINLMTETDKQNRRVNLSLLRKYYKQQGILELEFPISDHSEVEYCE